MKTKSARALSDQKHIIKKTIIELEVPSSDKAHEIQQRTSYIFNRTLKQQIEQLCSKYSKENVLHRLGKMEIDLGTIKASSLETELPQKLTEELETALNNIVNKEEKQQDKQQNIAKSQKELLSTFIQTGNFPWWANLKNNNLLSEALETLIQKRTENLITLTALFEKRDIFLRRFVGHLTAESLGAYFKTFSKSEVDVQFLLKLFCKLKSISCYSKSKQHQTFWFSLLKASQTDILPIPLSMCFLRVVHQESNESQQSFFQDVISILKKIQEKDGLPAHRQSFAEELLKTLTKTDMIGNQSVIKRNESTVDRDFFREFKKTTDEKSLDILKIRKFLLQLYSMNPSQSQDHILACLASIDSIENEFIIVKTSIASIIANIIEEESLKKDMQLGSPKELLALFSALEKWTLSDLNILSTDKIKSSSNPTETKLDNYINKLIHKKASNDNNKQETTTEADNEFFKLIQNKKNISLNNEEQKNEQIAQIISFLEKIFPQLKSYFEKFDHPKVETKDKVQKLILNTLKKEIDSLRKSFGSVHKKDKQLRDQIKKTIRRAEKETNQQNTSKASDCQTEKEEIFIQNAGLVILSPYIKYLFIALEYIEENEFISEEKQHRAALLLQYMCAPTFPVLEFQMPLAKVLCGMSPFEFIETDFEPTEREISESESLISIVIERAGIFKNLSNDGFRGSFILRDAKLSEQNKNWLVQVEKKTHDILLDKIPWNYKMIKLPWVSSLIQVDW